jgi:hypothetical protein
MAECPSTGYKFSITVGKFFKSGLFTILGIAAASALAVITGFVPPDGSIMQKLLWAFFISFATGILTAIQNWIKHKCDTGEVAEPTEPPKPV